LLLGDELDEQVKNYVRDVREKGGGGIDITFLNACGEAIVKQVDKTLLKEHGGPIDLSKSLAKSLFTRIRYIR